MGLFDSIGDFFSGGESKSKTKVKRVQNWNPEQQQLFQSLSNIIQGGVSQPSATAPQMFLPKTPEEESYLTWAKSQALQNMASGQPAYDVNPEASQNYYQTVLAPEIEKNVRSAYAGPGYWGSKRMQAESEQKSKAYADLMYQDELARRTALENAANRVIPAGSAIGSAGQLSRQIGEDEVMDLVSRYFMGEEVGGQYNPAYNPMLTLAYNLLGLQPFSYSGVQQGTSTGPGLGYGLLTGAAQGITPWLMK